MKPWLYGRSGNVLGPKSSPLWILPRRPWLAGRASTLTPESTRELVAGIKRRGRKRLASGPDLAF
jgi:hypothetical protein